MLIALWGLIVTLYWKLWRTLATREWVMIELQRAIAADQMTDRQLIADLLMPLVDRQIDMKLTLERLESKIDRLRDSE